MANGVAPVCPISQDQPVSNQPGLVFPFIPGVVDLPSAITAANAIAGMLQSPPKNNLAPSQPRPPLAVNGANKGFAAVKKPPNWVMTKRTTEVVRYQNPKDADLWVDVEEVKQLQFKDLVYHSSLTFTR